MLLCSSSGSNIVWRIWPAWLWENTVSASHERIQPAQWVRLCCVTRDAAMTSTTLSHTLWSLLTWWRSQLGWLFSVFFNITLSPSVVTGSSGETRVRYNSDITQISSNITHYIYYEFQVLSVKWSVISVRKLQSKTSSSVSLFGSTRNPFPFSPLLSTLLRTFVYVTA